MADFAGVVPSFVVWWLINLGNTFLYDKYVGNVFVEGRTVARHTLLPGVLGIERLLNFRILCSSEVWNTYINLGLL